MLRIRDFIETREGLIFAVVSYFHPRDKYHAYLRYYPSLSGDRTKDGVKYAKISSTMESAGYLKDNYPLYIDSRGQHVPMERIRHDYCPEVRLREILSKPVDKLEQKVGEVSALFSTIPEEKRGVTGSILVNLHDSRSDIDFVVYGTKNHLKARNILRELIDSGDVEELTDEQWRRIYVKRYSGEKTLSYAEFLWHERRKYHRGSMKGTIFDILLVRDVDEVFKEEEKNFQDFGITTMKGRIIDASQAFDSPSVYKVRFEDGSLGEIYSYTHTYAGQAFDGEDVEACGILKTTANNEPRLVVGTTREAEGEYIKVLT
ncbi:MAG: hypothetical protein QF829_04210 [Candidatus Hydrothermarchaeota archaeon]|nr:hypothetical protein [Candidatus Hydrothermarchaeota archaeon]